MAKRNKDQSSWFPTIWDDFFNDDLFPRSTRWMNQQSMPAVNVKETNDQIQLEVAAPGMDKKDFNVEFDNDMLIISAEHKTENTENEPGDSGFTRREFSYSSFRRAFHLPEHMVQGDQLKATYKEGILHVTIPKAEQAKKKPPRKIEIT